MLDALLRIESLPLYVVLSSFVPGMIIAFLREAQAGLRTWLNLVGAVSKLVLVGLMLQGVAVGYDYAWRLQVLPGLDLTLRGDALALLFVTLSAVLWLLTTVYAIGYLEGSPNRNRFFAFFSLCVTATTGIALAGDLFTFVIFYEALTWTTYPLVAHTGTPAATRAGRIYLVYTVGGGGLLLLGAVWLWAAAGTLEFVDGGFLAGTVLPAGTLVAIFTLLTLGFAVKAAMVPLHGWLPIAMVAPAPVSALLHAVAVVKAGAFGIVRLIYSIYGIDFATALGAAQWVVVAAGVTVIYGSLRALTQDDLKRRLAYSTVSQVSYIALGVAAFGPLASVGGMVHLVHQGLMKITLFFAAGILAETIGVKRVSEMNGVGRRMPWTMAAFTVGALGMIGIPPIAGFISKWYLGLGGLQVGAPWMIGILLGSTLLNAAYFLPILGRAWFRAPAGHAGARDETVGDAGSATARRASDAERGAAYPEADWRLLGPTLATAALSLGTGLLAEAPFSPLVWARLIVGRMYGL